MTGGEAMVRSTTQDRIVADAINRMFKELVGITPLMPLLPIVIAWAMWGHVEPVVLLTWCGFGIASPLMRLNLALLYRRRQPLPADAPRWARRLTGLVLIEGLLWGGAGVLFFLPESVPHQVVLLTLLIGMSAGSISITSYWPPTLYAMAIPSISMMAARVAYEGSPSYLAIAAVLALFLLILHQMVQQAHRATLGAVALRFENMDLVQELREQKAVAEQANVAKSKFLAAASHDLRQPLHALGLFVAALRDRVRDGEVKTLVDNISSSVGALDSLFNALLDISKLDAGIVEPRMRHIHLRVLLDRLANEYAPQARMRGLSWRCEGDDSVIHSDPALLETILRNVISNAIRYTERGAVTVTWGCADRQVDIEVTDTGIGIAPEHHQDVFQEFFQLHNPERDRNKGLGLGLAIVQRLTRLLRHDLELNSEPGVGTRLRMTLSAGDAVRIQPESDSATDLAVRDETGLTVLIIDDELAVREAMAVLLGGWGWRVLTAASLQEAQAISETAPDAIIADYRLRDAHTGAEAIQQLHRQWRRDVPALIITGDTAPERLRQAQDSGFAFLHKPVQPARLRGFLRFAARARDLRSDA
jgi:two-component system, sensor histidine kinase